MKCPVPSSTITLIVMFNEVLRNERYVWIFSIQTYTEE